MSNKGPIHRGTFSGRRIAYNADYVHRNEGRRRRESATVNAGREIEGDEVLAEDAPSAGPQEAKP